MSQETRIAIIVLNYNGLKHLEYSIPSIINSLSDNSKLFVVDNASNDDSLQFLARFPQVEIILSEKNNGYSAGNNLGIRHVLNLNFTHILIANNDIKVPDFWIKEVEYCIFVNPDIKIFNFDVHGVSEPVPEEDFSVAVEKYSRQGFREEGKILGMAFIFDIVLIDTVGFFDDNFFLYKDEDDWCLRAQSMGYRIYNNNIPVWHYVSGVSSNRVLFFSYHQYLSNFYFGFKHSGILKGVKDLLFHIVRVCFVYEFDEDIRGYYRRIFPVRNRFIVLLVVVSAFIAAFLKLTYNRFHHVRFFSRL